MKRILSVHCIYKMLRRRITTISKLCRRAKPVFRDFSILISCMHIPRIHQEIADDSEIISPVMQRAQVHSKRDRLRCKKNWHNVRFTFCLVEFPFPKFEVRLEPNVSRHWVSDGRNLAKLTPDKETGETSTLRRVARLSECETVDFQFLKHAQTIF